MLVFGGVWLMKSSFNIEAGWEMNIMEHPTCVRWVFLLSPSKKWCKLCGLQPTCKPLIAIASFVLISRTLQSFLVQWSSWWLQSLWKILVTSQIGSCSQVGVKIKNVWNHHPVFHYSSWNHMNFPGSQCFWDTCSQYIQYNQSFACRPADLRIPFLRFALLGSPGARQIVLSAAAILLHLHFFGENLVGGWTNQSETYWINLDHFPPNR